MKTFISALLVSASVFAADFRKDEIQRLDWGDQKTVWLEDTRYPVATIMIYFADGALRDGPREAGLGQTSLDLLMSGTPKYSQSELSEFFDFYGVSFAHNVTHEYSVLSFSALVKDLPAVVERFCHVAKEASYPRKELVSHKQRTITKFKNLPSQHAALAERAFRAVMMKGSSYEHPVEGNISSLELMQPSHLQKRWAQLRDEAVKRFYVKGPREALFIKDKFLKECGWQTASSAAYKLKNPLSGMGHKIFFVPVPGANQAQIRMGRYLASGEARDPDEKLSFATDYLGGGFTSQLVQQVRVQRGLTYSVGAYVSLQADYGRAGINTFTKNETVGEMLGVLKGILSANSKAENIKPEAVEHVRGFAVGNYPFSFEGSDKFLGQLLVLDHNGDKLEKLYLYPEKVKALGGSELAESIRGLYTWEEQVIVVVGDPSIRSQLEKYRPVEVVKPESLL